MTTDRRTPVSHALNARTPLDHLEAGLAYLRTADDPSTAPRPRGFCVRAAAAHFAAASAMQALGVAEHTLGARPAAKPRRVTAGAVSDVRPHVPHVTSGADARLHLIVDGVSACGLQSPQLGTHNPAETDCRDCTEALQRADGEDRDDKVARMAADVLDANERAQARHDAAGDDLAVPPASAGNRPTGLRSGEDAPAALARTAQADRIGGGGGYVADLVERAYDYTQQAAREPATVEAVHAPGRGNHETSCGIHCADTEPSPVLTSLREQVTCAACRDLLDLHLAFPGFEEDRAEGGEEL